MNAQYPCMTVPEFLTKTTIPLTEIAKVTDVHITTVYRWRSGAVEPSGAPLLRLIALSDGRIGIGDVPRKKRQRAA